MISRSDLQAARAPLAGFSVIGISWGAFAAQVPEIKAQIGAGDAEFGLAMLVSAIGAMMSLWLAPVADRVLAQRAMLIPTCLVLVGFVLAGQAQSIWTFTAAMLLCAAASCTVDVIINARISAIETRRGRPLMSFGHATFSFAYALAAIGAGGLRELGWGPETIFVVIAGVGGLLCFWVAQDPRPALLPQEIAGRASRQTPLIWLAGGVLLVAFMAEQATEAWSALHLERSLGASAAGGATGPAILGLTMCLGRLGGQVLVRWVSDLRIMALAAALSATGGLVAALAQGVATAYLGFALLGLGVSVLVPMAYAHVGVRVSEAARTRAIAQISVIGYFGFFIGPPSMGGLSEAFGLDTAFLAVALSLATIPALLVPALARLASVRRAAHAH